MFFLLCLPLNMQDTLSQNDIIALFNRSRMFKGKIKLYQVLNKMLQNTLKKYNPLK